MLRNKYNTDILSKVIKKELKKNKKVRRIHFQLNGHNSLLRAKTKSITKFFKNYILKISFKRENNKGK